MFYSLLFLLTFLSLGLVWFAFKSRETNSQVLIHQRLKRHVQLFNNNIKQLESDRDESLIDQEVFQSLYNEQARDLLDTAKKLEATDTSLSPLKGSTAIAFIGIIALALTLYNVKGAYPDYIISHELNKLSKLSSADEYSAALFNIKDTIEARVEQRPDSIEYRLLLAQLAMSSEDYVGALSHYSVVAELLPEDAQAQAYYAQALYLANNRTLDIHVAQL